MNNRFEATWEKANEVYDIASHLPEEISFFTDAYRRGTFDEESAKAFEDTVCSLINQLYKTATMVRAYLPGWHTQVKE